MGFTNIVDRRKNGKNRSTVNRNRFLKRAKGAIKKQVDEIVSRRPIQDIGSGDKITIPKKDIKEPIFNHGKGGDRDYVLPGNHDKIVNDKIPKPKGGGGGGPDASDNGEGEDDFTFNISREEFLEFFFEDLELPEMIKTNLKDIDNFKMARAGLTTAGAPNNLNLIRTMRNALGRKIALKAPFEQKAKELEEEYAETGNKDLLPLIEEQWAKAAAVPFIDDFDLRFNAFTKKPDPTTKAVMFCLMDVSGSMGEYEKDLAKRFFMLLYLFIERKYDKVDVVFIRHTTIAKEVDEQEFFYSKESGGTMVSTSLDLASEILQKRYPTADWNIYFSQASDGDNWHDDSAKCLQLLEDKIMPFVQYYAYVQVAHAPDSGWGSGDELWDAYQIADKLYNNFQARKINEPNEIYPVFRDLFKKEMANV